MVLAGRAAVVVRIYRRGQFVLGCSHRALNKCSVSASGRKRKLESSISSVFRVCFAPVSGHSRDRLVRGRCRPIADIGDFSATLWWNI